MANTIQICTPYQVLVMHTNQQTAPRKHCAAEDEIVLLADVDKQGLGDLVKLLKRQADLAQLLVMSYTAMCTRAPVAFRYKLRAKVDIADVSSEFTTWARFGPGLMPEGGNSLP